MNRQNQQPSQYLSTIQSYPSHQQYNSQTQQQSQQQPYFQPIHHTQMHTPSQLQSQHSQHQSTTSVTPMATPSPVKSVASYVSSFINESDLSLLINIYFYLCERFNQFFFWWNTRTHSNIFLGYFLFYITK